MTRLTRWILQTGAALLFVPVAIAVGQGPTTPPPTSTFKVVHVLGLGNIKRNAKCKLAVQPGTVEVEAGAAKAELGIASILDVVTGQDSKHLVGGTLGTVTRLAAPYETGRFLSLFREKIDVLTVEYQDSNGGLHGAVFTLPKGQAALVKKQLIAQGARAGIPVEEEEKQPKSKEGQKP